MIRRLQLIGNDNYRLAWSEQHPGRSSLPPGPSCAPCNDDWPDQEVYFPQVHPPGREAQFDFTHCGELKVTIAGQSYPHLLFQLILSHSGWRYAEVAAGRPSWPCSRDCRMPSGPWAAFQRWCAATIPRRATHELRSSRGRALNDNYAALLDHYGLRSTRINPGQSHENGVAEHAHWAA